MQRRAVRPRVDQLDGRGTAVQPVGDAPPKPLVQMGPVDQHHAARELGVAQPSLLAGPRSTGDEAHGVDPEGGEGLIDQTARHHVLPHGHRRTDPGTPAYQVGLGPLEDGYVVTGPVQERRCRTAGDRSPDNADSHAYRRVPCMSRAIPAMVVSLSLRRCWLSQVPVCTAFVHRCYPMFCGWPGRYSRSNVAGRCLVVAPAVASERDLRALAAIVSENRPDLPDGEGLPPSLLADLMGQIRCDFLSLDRSASGRHAYSILQAIPALSDDELKAFEN